MRAVLPRGATPAEITLATELAQERMELILGQRAALLARFGVAPILAGGTLRVEIANGHRFIAEAIEAFPGAIQSIALHKPTLEDVFMLVTKGDLLDQENKLARSGLQDFFQQVEVVNDKTREVYEKLLKKSSIEPSRFLMVGNSLRSDILPILELGGQAVYVPYQTTWVHEVAEIPPPGQPGFYQIEHLGMLPALLERLERS